LSTATASASQTYTTLDIEKVVRRFTADLLMIAQSTGALDESSAKNYAGDIELLARKGYLSSVDVTLISNGIELRAVRYTVNSSAGELETSRPGGVLWPRTPSGTVRIILYHTASYDAAAEAALAPKLKIGWVATTADTSHLSIAASGNRDYASNGWAMQRKDWGA
jgi:hypothetical protein